MLIAHALLASLSKYRPTDGRIGKTGKSRRFSLGGTDSIDLESAKSLAKNKLAELARGVDPRSRHAHLQANISDEIRRP